MRELQSSRGVAALMLGVTFFTLAACNKKDAGTADTGLAMNADSGMTAGMSDTGMSSMGAAPSNALSDPNIVYILDAANKVDSAAGSIAATKGTNSEVREYGRRMASDHHSLRKQGQDLATKLGVTPAPPAGDTAQANFDKTLSMLNGATKGRDFDKAYIDHEIAYHKEVLATATVAMNAAQNAELKNLIQKAAPVIQGHLDLAQSIQSKLQ